MIQGMLVVPKDRIEIRVLIVLMVDIPFPLVTVMLLAVLAPRR